MSTGFFFSSSLYVGDSLNSEGKCLSHRNWIGGLDVGDDGGGGLVETSHMVRTQSSKVAGYCERASRFLVAA